MHADIKFVPVEGAKYVNKAMVRTYDAQGIMIEESEAFKAADEAGKDKLEVSVDIPPNGKVEIESQSTTEVDSEQKAAVPPEEQQSEQVRTELKKKGEEREKQRQESLHRAALERGVAYQPSPTYPGSPVPQHPSSMAGMTSGAPTPHAESKEGKADLSKNPSPSPGQVPKPPMGDDKRK